MLTLATPETGSSTTSKPTEGRTFKLVMPMTSTVSTDIVRAVLRKLGLTGGLLDEFLVPYPKYVAGEAARLDQGTTMTAARKAKLRRIEITIGATAGLVDTVNAFLRSKGIEPPYPSSNNGNGGGGAQSLGGNGLGTGTGVGTGTGTISRDVFERVYKEGQALLTPLINALTTTLAQVGCGTPEGRMTFEDGVRKLLVRIGGGDLAGIQVSGTGDKAKGLLGQIAIGFGAPASLGSRLYEDAKIMGFSVADSCGGDELGFRNDPLRRVLDRNIHELHDHGHALYGRLETMVAEISTPYDASRGVDQACGLLKQFPDVAQTIYAAAGLEGIASFPPQPVGTLNADAEAFSAKANEWAASAARWEWIKLGGLVIAGIALTIITQGMAGPLAATLVGVGFGTVTGIATVVDAENNLRFQLDAALFGGASEERIEFAQGEVQGAYAALVINVITMGALARFGGNSTTPMLSRLVRITALSGASGGLTTAMQPNVWRSPNAGGLILWGTLVNAGVGAFGAGVGLGASRLLKPGAPVQIAIPRGQGPLTQGKTVLIQLAANEKPVNAVVTAIADDTITLRVDGSALQVRVARAAKIEGNIFDPKLKRQAMRVVEPDDFTNKPVVQGYTDENGKLVPGVVKPRFDGNFDFKAKNGPQSVKTRPQVLVYDQRKHARLVGVAEKDLQAFSGVQNDYSISKVPNARGFFIAIPKNGSGRLAIVPGPSRDSNGAFENWATPERPTVNMRGQGQTPSDGEIALFGAHGAPYGFLGITTRNAGRLVADTIVTLNEMQAGRTGPLKAVELTSCSQGTRRFFVLGKTNAEAMQKHIDARLVELGYAGEQKITVLAADRMGSLYGVDWVKVNGKFQKTIFVPAGTQRPLAYRSDVVARLPIVAVVLSTAVGGSTLVGMAALIAARGGPENAWRWLEANRRRIIGWVFDEPPN